MNIQNRIDEIYEELIEMRRDFHKNPELSQYEFRTQKKNPGIFKCLGN